MLNKSSLKWCSFASIAMALLSLLPQAQLWLVRGSQWQGAYATVDGDEFLYSAYINALIEGRPRRNDPFSGRVDDPKAPLPESTFSIQFIPPFLIASIARFFGASASTAFVVLIGLAALLATMVLFWFLLCVTGDNRLAAAGAVFALSLGGSAAGQGLLGFWLKRDISSLGLPFLRRYQPAATFFVFFLFCTLIWLALTAENKRPARLYAALSGVTIGILIFSYLYLWTAAAAWLICVILLWLYFRSDDRRRAMEVLAIVGSTTFVVLPAYLYLLLGRSQTLDQTQTLIRTHRPDLVRVPEIIGAVLVVLLVFSARRKRLEVQHAPVIFAAAFALLPLVLFNQQVVTGRSMQPFHFENFIANYAVLVGVMIFIAYGWRPISSRALLCLAASSLLWGAVEVVMPARARLNSDTVNDQMVPVLRRLNTLSNQDGTVSGLRNNGKTSVFVFSPHIEVLRLLPTWAAQGTAIGLGGLDFGSASKDERKVYAYLYYSGIDANGLVQLLLDRTDDTFLNYYTRSAVFGHERVLANLSLHPEPIQNAEIDEQARAYETYVTTFSKDEAQKHPISYVVVRSESGFDFSRIDRWYERSDPERIGSYELYRVKLRP